VFLWNSKAAGAFTRNMATSTERIENITYRKVEFKNRKFDVYINHNVKFISVHGRVDQWKDLDKVEDHFKILAPNDYRVYCDIECGYSHK